VRFLVSPRNLAQKRWGAATPSHIDTTRYELTCRNSLINQANLVEVDNNPNGACHDKFSAR